MADRKALVLLQKVGVAFSTFSFFFFCSWVFGVKERVVVGAQSLYPLVRKRVRQVLQTSIGSDLFSETLVGPTES